MNEKSTDCALGLPYNLASYALMTMMIAQCSDMETGEFIWSGGDTHIYLDQLEGVQEQLTRTPTELPTITINPEVKDIYSFKVEDFTLNDYNPQAIIVYPKAV